MTNSPNNEHPTVEAPSIVPSMGDSDAAIRVPALTFDPDAYREFLAGSDVSESQRQEFLRALWDILVGFVDLGFGIHPLNHVSQNTNTLEPDSREALCSEDISSIKREEVADRFMRSAAKVDS
jgi:hypothetical protein